MEEPNQSQSESPRLDSVDGKENIETPSGAPSQDKPDPQVERETLLKERDRLQSYKDEIETLALRINDTLIRLSEKLGEDEPTSDEGEDETTSDEEEDTRICIPQLNYVQPGKMRKYRNVPERYSAIDVISENANSYQNRQDQGHDSKEGKPTAVGDNDENTNLVENATAIPDRVVLNSERLKLTIDHDLWDGTLSWSGDEAYHILQPFKILFYLNQAIRKRLEEYKTTIATRKPPEEDVDAEKLQKDPRLVYRRRFVGDMDYTSLLSNINDLSCLVQFMDDHIEPVKARFQQHDPGPVRFTDLWFVFPPGTLVYVRDKNIPQKVWKVVQRTGGRRYLSRPDHIQKSDFHNTYTQFVLDCFYLDFDGVHYVPVYHQFKLNDFDGTQALGSLPVHPFRVSEIAKEKSRLLDQAHQFIECTKTSHRYYSGLTHSRTPDGAKLSEIPLAKPRSVSVYSEMVDSAVVVDFDRAFQEIPAWRPGSNDPELFQMSRDELDRDYYATDYDNLWDTRFAEDLLEAERRKRSRWEKNGELPTDENDLLILPDRVFAYVLRTRKWACLKLGLNAAGEEQLRVVQRRKEPWDHLELPAGHKDIVQSLIESHFEINNTKNIHFDLVRDKGKGVIILLHGVPGVGKTSTAECAAESNGRPLLPITCGDLGLSPSEVEDKLTEAFQLAQAWECVMLLDEADVFLARREPADTERNALVSVFLRVLEYYQGILFLTTNRVGTFDEAFKSRINMSLYYPPLSWEQTQKIWISHINMAAADHTIFTADTQSLVQYAESLYKLQQSEKRFGPIWNGRQIRNAFRTAVALASFRAKPGQKIQLLMEHFDKVALVSNQFNDYIWHVKKTMTDSDMAKLKSIRADEFVPLDSSQLIQQQFHHQQQPQQVANHLSPGIIPRGFTPVPQAPGLMSSPLNPHASFASHNQGQPQQFPYNSGIPVSSVNAGYGVSSQLQNPQQNMQFQQFQQFAAQQGMQQLPQSQNPPQQVNQGLNQATFPDSHTANAY